MRSNLSRKLILSLVLILCFMSFSDGLESVAVNAGETLQQEKTVKEIAKYAESVVMIKGLDDNDQILSQGSAFCISKGLFLTNYHVIEGINNIIVETEDDREYEVEGIVKYDADLDLAIIKTKEPIEMKPLEIGSKNDVIQGDKIVTIGSPKGYKNTVSDGVVSGFREYKDVDLIQISAPITNGSSGGPLFNMKGQVVGVNSSGYSSGNLNFAIAIDVAKPWIEEVSNKKFSEINVLNVKNTETLKDLNLEESKELSKEILNEVNGYLNSFENEEVDEYLSHFYYASELDYQSQKIILQQLFDEFSFDTQLVDYDLLGKQGNEVTARVVERTKIISESTYLNFHQEIETTSIITFSQKNGKWKIVGASAEDQTTEYRDYRPIEKMKTTIGDLHINTITNNSAQINWKSNVATLVEVQYGLNEACSRVIKTTPEYELDHSIELTNLNPNTKYYFKISYKDLEGNSFTIGPITFTTNNFSNIKDNQSIKIDNTIIRYIDLKAPLYKIVYNEDKNKAYGIYKEEKKIVVLDLQKNVVEKEISLVNQPLDLAVANDKNKMYIVNKDSTIITILDLDSYEKVGRLSWNAPYVEDENYHFHIYYKNQYLYIVDGDILPGLWRINPETSEIVDDKPLKRGIGDIAFTEDGNQMFYWDQFTWDNASNGCEIYRSLTDNDMMTLDYGNLIDYVDFDVRRGSSLDTPIIIMEDKNMLISKYFLVNMHDLDKVNYTFPEEIYAIDPKHRYAIGKENIYDLKFFDIISTTPKQNADQYFFDKNGIMYMLVNEENKLYYSISDVTINSEEKETLRINIGSEITSLDPQYANSTASKHIMNNLYEGLMKEEDGQIKLGMAESYTVSKDGKTYIFKLKDAKWSDGQPVTAGDFAYAWKRAIDPWPWGDAFYASKLFYIKGAKEYYEEEGSIEEVGIEVIDNKTLKVTLNEPTPFFLRLTTHPVYLPVREDVVEENDWDWHINPNTMVSNGPFKLERFSSSTNLTLSKNQEYYDAEKVKLNKIKIYLLEDADIAQESYELGRFHILDNVPREIVTNKEQESTLIKLPRTTAFYFRFNILRSPFNNIKVRKALSLALNRESISEYYGKNVYDPATGMVADGINLSDGTSFRQKAGDYDIEVDKSNIAEAKKLLAEAGYSDINDIGEIVITCTLGSSGVVELIKQMWEDNLGIKVIVDVQESSKYNSNIEKGNYDIAFYGWAADYNDAENFFNTSAFDLALIDDVELYQIIEDSKITNEPERDRLLLKAEKIIMDNMYVLPIFYKNDYVMIDDKVKNWERSSEGFWYFANTYIE